MSALDDKYALTLWELASQYGSPVEVSIFERVVGITIKAPRGAKEASPANQRQTWGRFRRWCEGHGLEIRKRPVARGEPTLIEFDRAIAKAVAEKVRPRLSRGPATKQTMGQRSATPINNKPRNPEVLDAKELAGMLLISPWAARALMRERPFPVFPVRGRPRVLRSDVLAWIESQKKGGTT